MPVSAFVDTNFLVRDLTGGPVEMTARAMAYEVERDRLLTDVVVAEGRIWWRPGTQRASDADQYGAVKLGNIGKWRRFWVQSWAPTVSAVAAMT